MNDELPIFQKIDGKLVPKPGNVRDPARRYNQVCTPDSKYVVEFTEEEEAQRDSEEAQWKADQPKRELESQTRWETFEKFKQSLKYETRYVAFIDILGWSKVVENESHTQHGVQRLGLAMNHIRSISDYTKELSDIVGKENHWQFGGVIASHFSDNLVLSYEPTESGRLQLIGNLSSLTHGLLLQGFLLRGGITKGDIYHDKSMVFGPALLRAYHLESQVADHPRIILDEPLASTWAQGDSFFDKNGTLDGIAKTWRTSNDGQRFFDYLQPPIYFPPSFRAKDCSYQARALDSAHTIISKSLTEHKDDEKILRRMIWTAKYYNEVCEERGNRGVKTIIIPS